MKTRITSTIISTVACLGVLCATLAGIQTVHAGDPDPPPCTIFVTNTADNGPGSLRDAVEICAGPGQTITFNTNGVFATPQTIVLTNGEIVIDKNLTILGPGADRVAISGNYPNTTNRVFHITPSNVVTIVGLTITNGNVGSILNGGGILNERATLTLSNCTVTGNSAAAAGGILNDGFDGSATLTIVNSTISDNRTTSGLGGGIWNEGAFSFSSATLTLVNSTVRRNHAVDDGGGIFNDGRDSGHATVTVLNSTFSGNKVDDDGGGIANIGTGGSATLTVSNSTFSGNLATNGIGGGIINDGSGGTATVVIVNSTVSGNAAHDAGGIESVGRVGGNAVLTVLNSTFSGNSGNPVSSIYINSFDGSSTLEIGSTILNAGSGTNIFSDSGTITSDGYNLISDGGVIGIDTTGSLNATGDQTNTPPLLGPLANNGGPTPTHAPLCGSPAIDNGTNFLGLATDQRGFARTVGGATDIGAVELAGQTYTVSNIGDAGAGSLRQAILDANAHAGDDTIVFNPGVTGTITLTSGELLITDCLFIDGPGATNVALNGNNPVATNRVFHVVPGIDVTIAGLTITNGLATGNFPAGLGGGIFNDHSTLTVSNCTISGNSAETGGGIRIYGTDGSATLEIVNSTFSGNSADSGGGAIASSEANGRSTLEIVNSTFSTNSAFQGGAIFFFDANSGTGAVTVANSTFSGNVASEGTGFILDASFGGTTILTLGSTILDHCTFVSFSGTVISRGYNLSSDNGGGFLTATGDQTNTPPLLGPLQLNGGQTPTHALLAGSPAIDAGTNFTDSATDQRGEGFQRTIGAATDVGAFEVQTVPNQPPVAACSNITVSAGVNCNANASIDAGSTDSDAGDMITLEQSPAGPYSLGTTPVTLTVTDSHNAQDSCIATVTVVDATAPTITCPANITNNTAAGVCSAVVNFATPTASDNCGSSTVICTPASGSTFAKSNTTVTCKAFDVSGNTNTCTFTVTVVDNQAPVITVKPAIVIKDNNHKYRTFSVGDFVASVSDNCEALTANNCVISQVTSDEPDDAPGNNDGNTKTDIKIASGCKSVQLMQERDAMKNGRVYKITLKVKDGAGNIGQAVATASVPLSSNGAAAIDSGVAQTVTGCTP